MQGKDFSITRGLFSATCIFFWFLWALWFKICRNAVKLSFKPLGVTVEKQCEHEECYDKKRVFPSCLSLMLVCLEWHTYILFCPSAALCVSSICAPVHFAVSMTTSSGNSHVILLAPVYTLLTFCTLAMLILLHFFQPRACRTTSLIFIRTQRKYNMVLSGA